MIIIPQRILDEMASHAAEARPLEACGYLAGWPGKAEKLIRLTNIDMSPEHFSFDPKEQFQAHKESRKNGLSLIAVYHSHPVSLARLSEEDKQLAFDPEIIYVIHSLLNNETKAFDSQYNEVKIEVV